MTTIYLDISLHSTGYCILLYKRGKPHSVITGALDNSLKTERQATLRSVFTAMSIINLIDKYDVQRVIVEDYAYSKFANSRAASTLAEIRGALNIMTVQYGIMIEYVAPNTSIKSLTGSGRFPNREAKKKATIDAANQIINGLKKFDDITYDTVNITDDNIADAFALFYHDKKDSFK